MCHPPVLHVGKDLLADDAPLELVSVCHGQAGVGHVLNRGALCLQVSEMEVNGQFESVCESVFSELESQAVEALDLPMPGCFRMRSHSYVRAIEKGCSQDDECISLRSSSPPRTTTTVRTIQSSTGESQKGKSERGGKGMYLSVQLHQVSDELFFVRRQRDTVRETEFR